MKHPTLSSLVRLMVRTPDSQSGGTGSIPVRGIPSWAASPSARGEASTSLSLGQVSIRPDRLMVRQQTASLLMGVRVSLRACSDGLTAMTPPCPGGNRGSTPRRSVERAWCAGRACDRVELPSETPARTICGSRLHHSTYAFPGSRVDPIRGREPQNSWEGNGAWGDPTTAFDVSPVKQTFPFSLRKRETTCAGFQRECAPSPVACALSEGHGLPLLHPH